MTDEQLLLTDALPFTDPLPADEEADEALAVELGERDLADLEGSDA